MFSTKKAQGLSLNTIIIAIIVLVVLVVLVMIFTGYFGRIFTPGLQNCETTLAGTCKPTCDTTNDVTVATYKDATAAQKAGCGATEFKCCREKEILTGPAAG